MELTHMSDKTFKSIKRKDSDIEIAKNKLKNDNSKVIRKLVCTSLICCIFMIAELVGGWISGSLAIMTDAAHLLSDLLAFVISIYALIVG